MLTPEDWQALTLSYKLAGISSVLLLIVVTPLAWWLANTKTLWKTPLEALFAMPLVLPPTVLGFYLLLAFTPGGALGASWFTVTGRSLAFSFEGLVISAMIYSLPFVLQPLQAAFEKVDPHIIEAAKVMGAKPREILFYQVIPLCSRGFLAAFILGFAHTLGEFGVILMIGGNIAGETRVASVAIFEHVEAVEFAQAHWLSAALVVSSFLLLLLLFMINRFSIMRQAK